MRKLFLLSSIFILFSFCADAQQEAKKSTPAGDTLKPYQKNPTLPAFNIKLPDNATIFNTYNIPAGKPTILMLFLPDCKHCVKATKELIRGMDSLQDIQFYLATPVHDTALIIKYCTEFQLEKYKNIKVVGRDYEFFFHDFYGVMSVPDFALYDKNKKLVRLFEGEVTVSELYKYSH